MRWGGEVRAKDDYFQQKSMKISNDSQSKKKVFISNHSKKRPKMMKGGIHSEYLIPGNMTTKQGQGRQYIGGQMGHGPLFFTEVYIGMYSVNPSDIAFSLLLTL